ncbi:MAG TPA: 6,7-dimethyl-8-ribityllumazine synthase, partial [Methylocystis sp.]|nr:6,7-dimethyl-8-ribityllumazine synthase [Methylocystis sp.]
AQAHLIEVPGALEIAPAAAIALELLQRSGKPYDGVVALGCVIRGETYHFEIVANESARALSDLAVARRLPLGNGILTVENEEQALARADPAQGNKGGDAAFAALALIRLKRELEK